MSHLKLINFDFRELLYVNRAVYKRPLIPSVLWITLDKTPIHRWKNILRLLRVDFSFEFYSEAAHTCVGLFIEEEQKSVINAMISTNDTRHNLIFQVIQAVMHEYIHASQAECNSDYFNEGDTAESTEEYLSEWREIQALAHCAYLEIMDYTDRPTRTVEWYQSAPPAARKKFYKFIYRWHLKYNPKKNLSF